MHNGWRPIIDEQLLQIFQIIFDLTSSFVCYI